MICGARKALSMGQVTRNGATEVGDHLHVFRSPVLGDVFLIERVFQCLPFTL